MTTHQATLRPGIVGPGEPGQRTFEANWVIECDCGFKLGCASSKASAVTRQHEHNRTGR